MRHWDENPNKQKRKRNRVTDELTDKPACLIMDESEMPSTEYYVAPPLERTDWYVLMQSSPLRQIDDGPASELPRLIEKCEQLNAEYDMSLEATIARIHEINVTNEAYRLIERLNEAQRQQNKLPDRKE